VGEQGHLWRSNGHVHSYGDRNFNPNADPDWWPDGDEYEHADRNCYDQRRRARLCGGVDFGERL
jgi:hypothetical protein